ncbi:hypothetical protein C8R43DRAFT_920841 [Mycena crocata]|nr:hypothetical protein C8R43DRAFT_920841 [Mycena crocata]
MSNEAELKQIDGLWFSNDALIILRAEESIFRVQKSILAARSPVFRGMFEFPQPVADGDEMMDGSPVVRLHDSAADVEPFLRAIFDSSYFMPPPAEVEFCAVLGILRLGHKYDVDYLFKRALLHLERVYPTTLEESLSIGGKLPNYENAMMKHDLLAVPILHETGATWLLPYAYYNVGSLGPDDMISVGAPWEALPQDMKATCMLLQGAHQRATRRINTFLGDPSTCPDRGECNSVKLAYLGTFMAQGSAHDWLPDAPFAEWIPPRWRELKKELCRDCFKVAQTTHDAAEAEIWDELPKNCGLGSWEVVLERRKATLA